MRVVIFFVCLCFLLFGGNIPVHTSIHYQGPSLSKTHHPERSSSAIIAVSHQDPAFIKKGELSFERNDLLYEEMRDEDEAHNNALGKNHKHLARFQSIPAHTYILEYGCNCQKDRLSFCSYSSCKYIAHNALRI